jgi:hypothetical protein
MKNVITDPPRKLDVILCIDQSLLLTRENYQRQSSPNPTNRTTTIAHVQLRSDTPTNCLTKLATKLRVVVARPRLNITQNNDKVTDASPIF